MRNEEFAYQEGFRVSKEGVLSNKKNLSFNIYKHRKCERFSMKRNEKWIIISIGRLQAFQKFGKELYNFREIRFNNFNSLDCSWDNISLGNGAERVNDELRKLDKVERAFKMGYHVDAEGRLLFKDIDVNELAKINSRGYKVFRIPFNTSQGQAVFLHRLQAFQKFGQAVFSSECVRHLNGNSVDNSWENIAIGSIKDNVNDIPLEVKAQQVLKIALKNIKYPLPLRAKLRKEFLNGEIVSHISKRYNIPYGSVKDIVHNNTIV